MKHLIMISLVAWATVSFLALCADDSTQSVLLFILAKAAALASLWLSFKVIRKAEKSGMLPDIWYSNIETDDTEI